MLRSASWRENVILLGNRSFIFVIKSSRISFTFWTNDFAISNYLDLAPLNDKIVKALKESFSQLVTDERFHQFYRLEFVILCDIFK